MKKKLFEQVKIWEKIEKKIDSKDMISNELYSEIRTTQMRRGNLCRNHEHKTDY